MTSGTQSLPCSIVFLIKVCCLETLAPCGPKSPWVQAPIMKWDPTTIQISATVCQSLKVAAVRYAWRDWPCDFKACPVYSASRILPAPPFIISYASVKGGI